MGFFYDTNIVSRHCNRFIDLGMKGEYATIYYIDRVIIRILLSECGQSKIVLPAALYRTTAETPALVIPSAQTILASSRKVKVVCAEGITKTYSEYCM